MEGLHTSCFFHNRVFLQSMVRYENDVYGDMIYISALYELIGGVRGDA